MTRELRLEGRTPKGKWKLLGVMHSAERINARIAKAQSQGMRIRILPVQA